jgi:asparagine synthase (glutamine-hydrolysing)
MCGIAGFTHRNSAASRGLIERVTATLFHRGPNQQDCYVTPDICLGAVRLKIIDLAGGDQPMISPDGETVVAYNGEIYNHGEIRKELEALGYRFESHCDTEVVLHAFREWDTECFQRFRGMFAVAVWRNREKRLVLARDRMGIKPLYLFQQRDELYFGSELKAIFEHPNIPRELDRKAVEDFLALNYVPAPRTLVKGLTKLPPGHFLEYRAGRTTVRSFWKIHFEPQRDMRLEAATERLDFLLNDAVREQMTADVPLGVWSSGGIDSSTMLHYAAMASARPLKTFSVGFASPSCDESRYFREMAARYGTDHHEIQIQPGDELIQAIEDFSHYSDEPGGDAGALPVWFLSKMTARHVTVALSGDGGDELFGGYLTYMADRLSRPLRTIPASLRRIMKSTADAVLPVSNAKISFEYKVKRFLEGSQLHPDDAHFFWNGMFRNRGDGFRGRLFEGIPSGKDIGHLNRYMMADQQTYLPDNILYKVDRMSMAHSIEVRPPFLDHRIVEFAASLPENMKIRGRQQKFLLKHLMKNKLPDSILNRSKKGFDIPTHEWFRGFLRPLLMQTVTPDAVSRSGIFTPDATAALIRDHMDRRINAGYHLWGLVTLFLWLKRWNIEMSPREESSNESLSRVIAATN